MLDESFFSALKSALVDTRAALADRAGAMQAVVEYIGCYNGTGSIPCSATEAATITKSVIKTTLAE